MRYGTGASLKGRKIRWGCGWRAERVIYDLQVCRVGILCVALRVIYVRGFSWWIDPLGLDTFSSLCPISPWLSKVF